MLANNIVGKASSLRALEVAPLVLGRLSHVNGEPLRDSQNAVRNREARDEHKLTHRLGNIDGVAVTKQITFMGRETDVGIQIYNLGGYDNPRDVVSNLASDRFGVFRNSAGTSIGVKVGFGL